MSGVCVKEKKPPTRLPAATPRTYDFNIIVGVDLLFVHGLGPRAEHPVINITCLGTLYSTFGLVDPLQRSAHVTWLAFSRLWLRTSGAPQYLVFDEGREFTASTFQEGLERHGIIPLEVARNAPFTNGVVERRGGLFKEVYYRTRELVQPTTLEEVEILVFEVSWSLQTLTNRSGYSPAQRVLGKQPTLALDTLSDQREYHLSTTQDAAWQRAHEIRTAARTALIQVDAKARLARARLGRPRREIENLKFSEGEPVLVWRVGRRGATAKVGPCYVIHQEGHIVWVTRRGEIWKCHVSQVFKMSVADQAGLEMIPAELLEAKARLRYDSEKMQFVDVVSEADGDRRPGSGGPPDGRVKQELHDDRQLPTEIPVPDPLQDISGIDQNPEQLPADDSVQPANNDERHDDLQLPAEIPVPDPVVINIDSSSSASGGSSVRLGPDSSGSTSSSSSSSGSSSSTSTPRAPHGQAEWPPQGSGTQLRKWSRFDRRPVRFRTSNSRGPMWSDVVQRISIDNDTGQVIKRENFNGTETSKDLHRQLPVQVRSLRTVLVYKRVDGHPDPGQPLEQADRPEVDADQIPGEDSRLFDQRMKRSLDDVAGRTSDSRAPMRRSRVFGTWVADQVTEYGDKSKLPVMANPRDMQLFYKLESGDVVYYDGEIFGSFVALTKQSGKELTEKNFTADEVRLFNEAKKVEIGNLVSGNAIKFIRDRSKVEEIWKELPQRVMPSRFILTKKSQELGEGWKAKARWILLGHRDPDVMQLERFSPTPATTTVYLVFQLVSSLRYQLFIMDVTSAFGQSDPQVREQGPLYASLPKSGIPDEESWHLIEVLTAAYGLVNAPSAWRKTVVSVLTSLSYKESVFDPCLYYLPYQPDEVDSLDQRGCAGIVLLDVDDFAQGGNARHHQLMQRLRERFKFGKWRCLYNGHGEYLGRTIRQDESIEIRCTCSGI